MIDPRVSEQVGRDITYAEDCITKALAERDPARMYDYLNDAGETLKAAARRVRPWPEEGR